MGEVYCNIDVGRLRIIMAFASESFEAPFCSDTEAAHSNEIPCQCGMKKCESTAKTYCIANGPTDNDAACEASAKEVPADVARTSRKESAQREEEASCAPILIVQDEYTTRPEDDISGLYYKILTRDGKPEYKQADKTDDDAGKIKFDEG